MKRVRCPRCSSIVHARGDNARCSSCGLQGRVDTPAPKKDPWQITIDLRKLNPAHWGAGARSFVMFILLVGVFFAGGVSGVVFERTRSDIAADINDGSLFSSDDTAKEGPVTTPDTSDAQVVDESPPVLAADSLHFQDTDHDPSAPFALENRLLRIKVEYYGDHTFSLRLTPEAEGGKSTSVAASQAGDYVTTRYVVVDEPGDYTLKVGTAAFDGAWSLTIEQPGGEEARTGKAVMSADGDAGKGPMLMAGAHDLAFTPSPGMTGLYTVTLYSEAGERLPCTITGTASDSDRETKTRECSVPTETAVYFDIVAPRDPDGKDWELVVD